MMMWIKQIHTLISIKALFWLVFILALIVQMVVISYNHYSGYFVITDFQHFLSRLVVGFILSYLAGFVMSIADLAGIARINKITSWKENFLLRLLLQFGLTLIIAIIFSSVLTMLSNLIREYDHDLKNVLFNNALIFSVVNVLLMSLLEGLIASRSQSESQEEARHLQEKLSEMKYELLKSQLNPHFMFNSLNTLSILISQNPKQAERFVDEFSLIYRYVLEMTEEQVTTLAKELDFLQSYFYLQQIRFGEHLSYSLKVSATSMNKILPPLSLQTILENAIKHNIVNETKPLHIDISIKTDYLEIKNHLQPKTRKVDSTGIGLQNLSTRYALLGMKKPSFYIEDQQFIAKLPLLETHSTSTIENREES